MSWSAENVWVRSKNNTVVAPSIGLMLDVGHMSQDDNLLNRQIEEKESLLAKAFHAMRELENGAIANPDEQRMVGHYWLRDPQRAPSLETRAPIQQALIAIQGFCADIHSGRVRSTSGEKFTDVLLVGIGGSALGPQFVSRALAGPKPRLALHFFDNTDPDGFQLVLDTLDDRLKNTLVLVVSKSGGTKETRNGMLEVEFVMRQRGLDFEKHAVAVTSHGSALDQHAVKQGWLARFPMWDWVGGRTSELSAVGLLPAALQGIDIDSMLRGACECDKVTRVHDARMNPAAAMALMWHFAGEGRGRKDLVVLPYKDRIELFSRYLQQLIMESLGKERDLDNNIVNQGLAVYGNKGSTDQHAYVQQLRDGVPNFFVTFIEVLKDSCSTDRPFEVEPGVTSGDYLLGFLLGTRQALFESQRQSMTLTIDEISPFSIGVLIALFERAVGLYASMININAYHQPGVEAGKKAAADVLSVHGKILAHLQQHPEGGTANAIAESIGIADVLTVFKVLLHLAYNNREIAKDGQSANPFEYRFFRASLP